MFVLILWANEYNYEYELPVLKNSILHFKLQLLQKS